MVLTLRQRNFLRFSGGGVFGTVYDAEVFAASAFDGGLDQPAFFILRDEIYGFDDHAFATLCCFFFPPGSGVGTTLRVVEIDDAV